MKKLFFLTLVALITTLTTQAQIAIGGSLGINIQGGHTETGNATNDKATVTRLSFAPLGGFFITEKLLVGAQLSLSTVRTNDHGNPEVLTKVNNFGLAPFARYYAISFQKFSIFGQAQFGVGFGTEKTKSGGTTTTTLNTTNISFTIVPGIAYDISEKIQLQAHLNFAGYGTYYTHEKDVNGDIDVTTETGLNINLNNIANTGDFSIGAIIKL